jgi:hypothetical protein
MQFEEDGENSERKEALARALGMTISTSTASCSSIKLPRRVVKQALRATAFTAASCEAMRLQRWHEQRACSGDAQ